MTFGEYRKTCNQSTARFYLQIIEGKNLRRAEYAGADFEEDGHYILDDYDCEVIDVNYGFDIHRLRLKGVN